MRRRFVWLSALALLALVATASAQADNKDPFRQQIDFAKSKIYPALVNINVISERFSAGRTIRVGGGGSGTIIGPGGEVLTNFHVARDAARITCTLTTGEEIPADVVGHDPATDLSILKLRLHERRDTTKGLPFALLGDSDTLRVGESVIAVGNPLSLSSSMTLGIVSNPRRVFTAGNRIQEFDFGDGNKTGMFTVWIQHDALILPGNSGGPLVNLSGEVVGVNTRGGAGYGFASPSNLVRRVVQQIMTYGEVRRGWLGLSFLPVNKLGRTDGALVATVDPASPAAAAGVKPGDVLLEMDGKPVACRFLEQIPLLYGDIAMTRAEKKIEAIFERGGKRRTVQMVVDRMDKYVGKQAEFTKMGVTLQEITLPMMRARRYPDQVGLVVSGVRGGQVFEEAKPRIVRGDVILKIAGHAITDLDSFRQAVKTERTAKTKEVGVVYRRDREIMVTLVKMKKAKPRKPGGELAKPWLGAKTQVLTPKVAKALDLKGKKGFRVTQVYPWTKAAEAGLKIGDILIALDDEALEASRPQDARDLRNQIEDLSIGEDVTFTVLRDGGELKIEVELEESPASALDAKTAESESFEFKVRNLTFMDRIRRKLEKDQQGVLVTEVAAGGWASVAGLGKGAIIMAIGGKPVTDVKSFKKIMKDVDKNRAKTVQVFFLRGYRTSFVFIEPDWTKADAAAGKAETK